MTLKELGLEYLKEEKRLRARLKELKQQLQSDDAVMRRRIYYLTQEAIECHKIGLYLVGYYGEEKA